MDISTTDHLFTTTTTTTLSILRLTPLLLSTSSLKFSHTAHHFLITFLRPQILPHTPSVLPPFFTHWSEDNRKAILYRYSLTYLCATLNLLVKGEEMWGKGGNGSGVWYLGGLVFSLGHVMWFGKRALGLLERIKRKGKGKEKEKDENIERKGEGDGEVVESLREWAAMNSQRMCWTDVPAWFCFTVAAVKCM
ncbi:hypothetical protein BGZ60DRAFT_407841 [Tricladium varicosporioides]|nr:hypothetical protein BGZ60DRAFT_407841 [Hymenoscyphus varicosporioides]